MENYVIEDINTNNKQYKNNDNENSVVSVGDWVLTMLLSSIPVVNIIILLILIFSKKTPKSKKNWAIATSIFIIIFVSIYIIFFINMFVFISTPML